MNVLFAFEAGSHHFASGMYDVSKPMKYVVYLKGKAQSSMVTGWHEINLQPATGSKIVFYCYGNHYFLRKIWTAQSYEHMTFSESNEEKALRSNRMEDRQAVLAPSNVEVALLEGPR